MAVPTSSAIGGDARSLAALRTEASRDPKAAIREAAKQFETMFMQQLMKSMRESTMASGMLENEGTKVGTEMLDGQWATKMSGLPGGLADAIARQLERQMTGTTPAVAPQAAAPAAAAAGAPVGAPVGDSVALNAGQRAFVTQHQADARAAAASSGIPAAFMVAQAAHETGFGRSEIRHADGSTSHNLFGIKATAGWKGKVAEVTTTEYVDGQAQKVKAKFRAYDSYAESFADYARLLKDSPRYQQAVQQAAAGATNAQGFAQGLQKAGYATDPAYAAKLTRVINSTLRLQRAVT